MNNLIDKKTDKLAALIILSITGILSIYHIDNYYGRQSLSGSLFKPGGFYHHKNAEQDYKKLKHIILKDINFPKGLSEYAKAVFIMEWVYNRIKIKPYHDYVIPYRTKKVDFQSILIHIHYDSGGKVHCSDHQSLLMQSLQAFGYNVRMIGLSQGYKKDNKYGLPRSGHNVCEAFFAEYQKWIVMDSYAGIVYKNDKHIPLSALEIHNFLVIIINNWYKDYGPLNRSVYYSLNYSEILNRLNMKKQVFISPVQSAIISIFTGPSTLLWEMIFCII